VIDLSRNKLDEADSKLDDAQDEYEDADWASSLDNARAAIAHVRSIEANL
jgi:hypothetical protein